MSAGQWFKKKWRKFYFKIVREKASPDYIARGWGIGMLGAAGDDGAGAKPFTASGDENGGGTRSRLRRRSRVLGWGCCLLVAQPVANVTATPQAIARLIHLFFMFFVFSFFSLGVQDFKKSNALLLIIMQHL